MKTDIEDELANEWAAELQLEIEQYRVMEHSLMQPAGHYLTATAGSRAEDLVAVSRCRTARARSLALWRLIHQQPYPTREALDWAKIKLDSPTAFAL